MQFRVKLHNEARHQVQQSGWAGDIGTSAWLNTMWIWGLDAAPEFSDTLEFSIMYGLITIGT